jgi:hypothetical protein
LEDLTMKFIRVRFLVVVLAGLALAACGSGHDSDVDVTGVWTGTWEIGADHGFCVIELRQQADGQVQGGLNVRFDLPSLENAGVDVRGSVSGKTLEVKSYDSGTAITLDGDVTGEQASGSAEFQGQKGTWRATRLPSSTLSLVSSFEVPGAQGFRKMTMGGGYLWAHDGAALYRVDLPSKSASQMPVSDGYFSVGCGSGLAFDGQYVLCNGGSPKIYRVDLSGRAVGSFALSDGTWPDALAVGGQDLFAWHLQDYTLRRAGLSGSVRQTATVKLDVSDMTSTGADVLMLLDSPPAIVKADPSGTLLAGYQLPTEVAARTQTEMAIVRGIAWDGQSLWVSAQRLDLANPVSSKTYLYQLRIP